MGISQSKATDCMRETDTKSQNRTIAIKVEDLQFLMDLAHRYADSRPEKEKKQIKRNLDDIETRVHASNDGKDRGEQKHEATKRKDRGEQKHEATKMIYAQVHIPKHDGICRKVLELIQESLKKYGVELNTQDLERRDTSCPLIVMCLAKSRIGADVDAVIAPLIAGKSTDKKAWVIIIHDLKEHALPLGQTKTVLLDDKYNALAGYIDVAYQSDQGLYDCEMNRTAIAIVSSILQ